MATKTKDEPTSFHLPVLEVDRGEVVADSFTPFVVVVVVVVVVDVGDVKFTDAVGA